MNRTSGFYSDVQIMVLRHERELLNEQSRRLASLVDRFTPKNKVHNQTCPIGLGRNGGSGEMPCPCGGYGESPNREPTLAEAYAALGIEMPEVSK